MSVQRKGTIGADCDNADADDDAIGSEDVTKDDRTGNQSINPEEMPAIFFSSMIASFLWGHMIEDPNQECYRSKQFHIRKVIIFVRV
jgi:hypothetical protein